MTVNNQQKAGVAITEEMVKRRRKEGEGGGERRIEAEKGGRVGDRGERGRGNMELLPAPGFCMHLVG